MGQIKFYKKNCGLLLPFLKLKSSLKINFLKANFLPLVGRKRFFGKSIVESVLFKNLFLNNNFTIKIVFSALYAK